MAEHNLQKTIIIARRRAKKAHAAEHSSSRKVAYADFVTAMMAFFLLTDLAKQIIHSVASVLKNFPNEIAVEGHTDSSPTRREQISNWELSTARASSARRELEQSGIEPNRICRVVGFGDKVPLFTDSPSDPRNGRISIVFVKNKKLKLPDRLQWLMNPPEYE